LENDPLYQSIHNLHPLKGEEWEAFRSIWQPFSCRRKEVLTAAGETERYLYFVLEGVQRCFFMEEGHRDATIVFTYPHSFSGVADAFLTRTPSLFYFETLTPSRFLRAGYPAVEACMEEFPAVKTALFRATAWALKGVLLRQVELQCFSAEEKFRQLLRRSPQVLNLIPHKYLASYLGIDAGTFSKLLGSVRI